MRISPAPTPAGRARASFKTSRYRRAATPPTKGSRAATWRDPLVEQVVDTQGNTRSLLCGVAHSIGDSPDFNYYTPLDSPKAVEFLQAVIGTPDLSPGVNGPPARTQPFTLMDVDKEWAGECKAYRIATRHGGVPDETDTDNDDVIDMCDDCKFLFNPEQIAGHGLTTDQLGDIDPVNRHGSACNICPQHAIADINKEMELAVGYGNGASAPVGYPLLRGTVTPPPGAPAAAPGALDLRFPPTFPDTTQIDKYKESFVGDACDPVPVPVITLGGPPVDPPGPSGLTCPGTHCVEELDNAILIDPVPSPMLTAAVGPTGLPEPFGDDWPAGGATARGRSILRPGNPGPRRHVQPAWSASVRNRFSKLQCAQAAAQYTSTLWMPIASAATFHGFWLFDNTTSELNFGSFSESEKLQTYWDFQKLPAANLHGTASSVDVDGMLWAHVVSVGTTGYPIPNGLTAAEFLADAQNLGDTFAPGNAGRSLNPASQAPPNLPDIGTIADAVVAVPGGAPTRLFTRSGDPQIYAAYCGSRASLLRCLERRRRDAARGAHGSRALPARRGEPVAALDFADGQPSALRGVHVDATGAPDATFGR